MTENISIALQQEMAEGDLMFEEFHSISIYEYNFTSLSCLEKKGTSCNSDICEMENNICSCIFEETAGEGGGSFPIYEDAQGNLSWSENGTPIEYCVQGDLLSIKGGFPSEPTYKVYIKK
jgi:hypothetical protein